MNRLPALLALLLLALGPGVLAASSPSGTPLIGASPVADLARSAPNNAQATSSVVAVQGEPFRQAIRVQTLAQPAQPWDIQLTLNTDAPVAKGDVVLATFYARATAATGADHAGRVEFNFERAASPWEKSGTYLAALPLGGGWQRVDVPFTSVADYGPGQAHITLRLGYAPQTVEIAGLQLTDYHTAVSVDALPSSARTYAGRSADAPWRKAAKARIDQIRKGDFTVHVVDAAGRPVAGATVAVHMTKHAFAFGTAVNAQTLLDPTQTTYREQVAKLFNAAVIENALKWPFWETWGEDAGTQAVTWLRQHGLAVRGHNLVWPSWKHSPQRLSAFKDDPTLLEQAIAAHIQNEVGALKGQLIGWDVINEPVANHDLMDILGNQAMVDWFKAAHQADPGATLFVNDYNILSAGGLDSSHQAAYAQTISYLLDHGAPLGAIGLQSHFGNELTPPTTLLAILNRFAAFGLPLWITEFDVNVQDEQLQADYLRDFYTAAFSDPAVQGILMWGFWDGRHWEHNAPLFRQDWSLKPAGKVWMDLVFHQWWTDVTGTTAADGTYRTRGFLGQYTIDVSTATQTHAINTTLTSRGGDIEVVLD